LPQFDIVDELEFLEYYVNAWEFLDLGFQLLRRIEAPKSLLRVSPIDYVISLYILTFTQAALVPWKRCIYAPLQASDNQLITALLRCLSMARRGDLTIAWGAFSRFIDWSFQTISEMTSFISESGSAPHTLSHDVKDMEHFEVQYLQAVSDYHTGCSFLPEDTLFTNLGRFYYSWDLESRIVRECGLHSLKTQLKAWFSSMLKDYWGDIYAECEELFRANNEGLLALISTVVREVGGKEETERLRTIFKTHVKETALATVSRVHGGDVASPGDPVAFATALLAVEQEANKMWTKLELSMVDNDDREDSEDQRTDPTRKIIEEIIDEHPRWHDAMDKLRSRSPGTAHRGSTPERGGSTPEHGGSMPEHGGSTPEHGGSTPESVVTDPSIQPARRKRDRIGGFIRRLFKHNREARFQISV
jgi:hypothetical protein